jgi:hypothetical protein
MIKSTRETPRLLGLLMCLSAHWLWGCSQSPDDQQIEYEAPNSFDAMAIAEVVARAYCDAFRRCQPDIRPTYFLLHEACVGRLSATLTGDLITLNEAIEEGRILYSPRGLSKCLKGISKSTCHQIDIEAFEVHCADPFQGHLADGEDCRIDSECQGGFCPGEDGCAGRCRPLSNVGESCDLDGERQCLAGLDCDANRRCAVKAGVAFRADEGQRCDVVRCRPGYHCRSGPDRRCYANADRFVQHAAEGCPALDDTSGTQTCGADLICSYGSAQAEQSEGVCTAIPAIGQTCHPADTDPEFWCEYGAYCDGVDPQMNAYLGECRGFPRDGEPCGLHYGQPHFCWSASRCVDGHCRKLSAVHQACQAHSDCQEGRCVEQVCTLACLDTSNHQ